MIVIDVGCARYGGDYSIERLLAEFDPVDELYGFDPSPAFAADIHWERGSPRIILKRQAAWTYDGEIGFREDGLNSWITNDSDAPKVPCFDLAAFIRETISDWVHRKGDLPEVVLKLDCEAAEYELLEHLIKTRADALLKLVWVEWHDFGPDGREERRRRIEDRIACTLEEWNF